MTLTIHQLGGMIRYEMILLWRRRGLLVVTLAMLVISALILASSKSRIEETRQQLLQAALPADDILKLLTLSLLPTYWAAMFVTLMLTYPVMLVDTIPIDRQTSVRELLDTVPLTNATYLTGKLLGVWAATTCAALVVMIGAGLLWWLLIGPFEIAYYLEVWFVASIPTSLINSGMIIFLVIGQPSRRRAILVGIVFSIVLVLMMGMTWVGQTVNHVWMYLNPSHPVLFLYYMLGRWTSVIPTYADIPADVIGTPTQVAWTLLAGAAELAALWGFAWLWLRFREHR